MAGPKIDKRIDKRRITMTSYHMAGDANGQPLLDPDGKPVILEYKAIDYVRDIDVVREDGNIVNLVEAYVEDAKTRWQSVEVSEEFDAGPGGYDGETAHLEHLHKGVTLQEHLHAKGIKHRDDPTNSPHTSFADVDDAYHAAYPHKTADQLVREGII